MPDNKSRTDIFRKAKEELANGLFFKAAELFEQAAENTLSSKEKMKALTEALLIYIRPKSISSFSSAALVSHKISELLQPTSPLQASLYGKIEEYFNRLQEYVDKNESSQIYEQLLLKIKDCFLQMEHYIATALVFKNLGEIALEHSHLGKSWQTKRLQYFRESAYLFEKVKTWDEAGETYKFIGNAAREQQKYAIMEDSFLKAAECYLKSHNIKEAAICYDFLYCEEGLKDISKQLKYAMLSIEYSLTASDLTYIRNTLNKTEELIAKETDPHKRKDYLLMLSELAIQSKQYMFAAKLYQHICSDPVLMVTDKEKKEILAQIPGLMDKQRAQSKVDAETFSQSGDYLSAAETYTMLAEITEIPGVKWMYQLEAALNYGKYRVPLYAERSDEIYDQMGDINRHFELLEKSFSLAREYAPGEKEKTVTRQKAGYVCKELARFYGDETDNMYCRGESLGRIYRKRFSELGEKLVGE